MLLSNSLKLIARQIAAYNTVQLQYISAGNVFLLFISLTGFNNVQYIHIIKVHVTCAKRTVHSGKSLHTLTYFYNMWNN